MQDFKLRREQLTVLSEDLRARHEQRLVAHVSKQFPKKLAELGEVGLREKVRTCLRTATGYGMQSHLASALFTDAWVALGNHALDDIESVRAVLANDSLDGNTKARRIVDLVILHLELHFEQATEPEGKP